MLRFNVGSSNLLSMHPATSGAKPQQTVTSSTAWLCSTNHCIIQHGITVGRWDCVACFLHVPTNVIVSYDTIVDTGSHLQVGEVHIEKMGMSVVCCTISHVLAPSECDMGLQGTAQTALV
jgi:hypothetical protein